MYLHEYNNNIFFVSLNIWFSGFMYVICICISNCAQQFIVLHIFLFVCVIFSVSEFHIYSNTYGVAMMHWSWVQIITVAICVKFVLLRYQHHIGTYVCKCSTCAASNKRAYLKDISLVVFGSRFCVYFSNTITDGGDEGNVRWWWWWYIGIFISFKLEF